jgi:hypothetical protein
VDALDLHDAGTLEQTHEIVLVGLKLSRDSHTSNMCASSSP